MDSIRVYKKRSFIVIVTCMLIAGALAAGASYYGLSRLLSQFSAESMGTFVAQSLPQWWAFLETVFQQYYTGILPGIIGVFLFTGLFTWLVLSVFVSPVLKPVASDGPEAGPERKAKKKDFIDHKIEQERKRRLFLHTLSVLQREGRLLDFFAEDLSAYDDAQIGAAVRSIQEDCKKAVKKYIDPKPVVQGEEGESITIEDGFDIDAINLVGKVSGQPPFQGTIKHPGWRAGKKDVPKLSDIQDPGIMTPAEIEIQ